MIFPFLQYVRPVWYFNLTPKNKVNGYWVDYRTLREQEQENILVDDTYESQAALLRDASFQAWNAGIVSTDNAQHLDIGILNEKISLKDNYRFIRKYMRSIWSMYVLLIRIVTFHNPFKEIKAFFAVRDVKQIQTSPQGLYADYKDYHSNLVHEVKPLISVVIPTLNRYKYLYDVMRDLEAQEYRNFEVIVVDQSEPFDKQFYDQFDLDLNLVYQEEKALWRARNHAVKISKGEYILLFDDDSRIEPDWISENLKCIDYFDADISAGVSLSVVGAKVPDNYAFFRWADQLDTGNALVKKEIFKNIGLFDRQFEKQRMGDGEYGLRCYLNGYKSVSNPYAKRVHLKVSTGGLRQMGSWDGFRPKNIFAPRPIPSVLYLFRKYFGSKLSIFELLIAVPPSVIPYQFKNNRKMMLIGRIITLLLLPLVLIQVGISWTKASQKLKEGAKIEKL
jgi:glycosyltransferase involved in cell wall biosynthesis